MSRAFVKESDQEEAPIIPPRAALPPGVDNYVTPTGLAQLKAELADLEAEKASLPSAEEDEVRRTLTVLNGKIALLTERINSARSIDLRQQPADEIRFGATVDLVDIHTEKEQRYQIVGVDEADIQAGKIAFITPVARALNGRWVGEVAKVQLGRRTIHYRVKQIRYH